MGIVVACIRLNGFGRSGARFIEQRHARLANRPAECAAAHLSRDGKAKVRLAGTQFLGMKVFKKDRKEMLGGVVTSQLRKRARDLRSGAMNRRYEDQQ